MLTFRGKGNEEYQHSRSDLLIKLAVESEPDSKFTRSGNNLVYTHSMSLVDAYNSSPIQI